MNIIKWIRSRLLFKMLILYSLLTLIPLTIVSVTFYAKSKNLLEKKSAETAQQTLAASADLIESKLSDYSHRLINIGQNSLFISLLASDADPEHNPLGVEKKTLESIVINIMQSELDETKLTFGDYADSIYLLNTQDKYYTVKGKQALKYIKAFQIMPFEFDRIPEWAFFTDDDRIACVLKIFDDSTGKVIGRLILTLDPQKIRKLYDNLPKNSFYITNNQNLIFSASDMTKSGQILNVSRRTDVISIQQKSRYSEFHYVYLIPSKAGKVITQQIQFAFLITILSWLAVVIITYWILKRITVPIYRLTRLMRKAGLEEYILMNDIRTNDEIAALCFGYNQLVSRTQQLIEKNYKTELLQKEAELKAIRMYINPHFLYNTLEYISILAVSPNGPRSIPTVIKNLASIFRFSIAPGEAIVPLEIELQFVEKYLQIHQFRYGDQFQYTIDVPESIQRIPVPKLILQPIVENAMKHGIDQSADAGYITIRAFENNFQLIIEVENSADDLLITTETVNKGLGTGFDNVNARIRFHYGPQYGAELIYNPGSTVVRICLPITFL